MKTLWFHKFGLSWQIIPTALFGLDIVGLERAYNEK